MKIEICLIIFTLSALDSMGQMEDKFSPGIFHYPGSDLPFQLFIPASYDSSSKYPLILYLHGASARGSDNILQVNRPPLAFFVSDSIQAMHPSFILAPQCPSGQQWVDFPWKEGNYFQDSIQESNELMAVEDLLAAVIKEHAIDTNRLYVIGESMGGFGAWDLVTRNPNKFAATIPVVGAGDPSKMPLIKHMAIWGFHGSSDDLVPVSGTRHMMMTLDSLDSDVLYTNWDPIHCNGKSTETIETLIQSDAPPRHIYSEFEGVGHELWSTYMHKFDGLLDWLFSFSKPSAQTVGIFHDSSLPQLAFAAGDVKLALEERGLTVEMRELSTLNANYSGSKVVITLQTDNGVLNLMTKQGGKAVPNLGAQAYALRTSGASADHSCWVIGGDANGSMYGGLQVAEYITFSGLKGVHNEEDAPYIKRRGIKFNIPLDVRSPSFSDKGDAAKTNIKHMWDMSFWTEYFDVLARHRYNVISFWSKHPFTTMVKVPGYEDAVMEDVRDHDGLVKSMLIEEKISFWQDVMQLAHNRGLEIYFINWNIFTSGANGKYGISNNRTNPTTIDYTRKSVYQFLKTYPLLTGIGVSAGENFGDASFAQREEWLYATFGEALWDYYREDPDRDITFIHRYLDSGVGSIMAEFQNLPQKYRIDISFKYSLGHLYTYHAPTYIYKTQDTRENVVAQLDTYNKKCWMNLRNDDLFYLRWGSPDYVRAYLSNFPDKEKYVAGYYMGSDGYVWGRVFSSENALFQGDLEINKHWYRFMLWGRLGYNPNLPDSVFIHTIAARFGQDQAQQIFEAWNSGSKAFTTANSLIWWMWDGWWYPEGSKRAQGWRDVNDFINTTPPQGAPVYSIKEYKKQLDSGEPMEKLTPLELAAKIRAYANTALETVIHTGENKELHLISNDINALGFLGLYFAEKIEGAVYHHLGQKSKAISHMQKAYGYWKSYTEIGNAMYKDQYLARTGMFRWGDYDDDAGKDIKIVGGSGPGDNRFP